MSKQVKTKKVAAAVKPVAKPSKSQAILDRGKEFAALEDKGKSVGEIVKIFTAKGKKLSIPTVYNAIKLSRTSASVHEAILSGKVKSTEVLAVLTKGKTEKQVDKEVADLVKARKEKRALLAQGGFKGGQKLTNKRTVMMMVSRLKEIAGTKGLTDVRQQAVLAFAEGLDAKKSVDQLLADLIGDKKAPAAPKKATKKAPAKA